MSAGEPSSGRADFVRGYPVDERGPRATYGPSPGHPFGDFEWKAGRVVARLTGERVVLQDDGSQPGMADIRIDYARRPVGYVEVTVDIEPAYAGMWAELAARGGGGLPWKAEILNLSRAWQVTLSGPASLTTCGMSGPSTAPRIA